MLSSYIKGVFMRSSFGKKYRVKRSLQKCVLQYRLSPQDIITVENDDSKKKAILLSHMDKHQQKTEEIEQNIARIFDVLGITDEKLEMDILFCYFAYGFTPNEYFCYDLANKSSVEKKEFISDRESLEYANRLNDIEARQLFMDKFRTYNRFKTFYNREAICIEKNYDYNIFREFVKKHPIFVKKVVFESCGRSVELVDISKYLGYEKELFDSLIQAGKIIMEEKVCQSKELAALNSSSVNTVRCFTLNTRAGVIVPWCFLRAGKRDSFVDNGGAGGILLGLDCKNGFVNTDGVDENGQRYAQHPDTKIKFKGFQLPDWESMIETCKEMAVMEPEVKWIGWDMAHTDSGWLVIEGNALSETIGPQSTSQKGIKRQMDQYLRNVDLWMR